MRAQDLADLVQYSRWAALRTLDAARSVAHAQLVQPLPGSFGSLRDVLVHLSSVDRLWLGRIEGIAYPYPHASEFWNLESVRQEWSAWLERFCHAAERWSDGQLGCVIAYRSYEENHPPVDGSNDLARPGMDNACTNPGALGGGESYYDAYFPVMLNNILFQVGSNPGIATHFARFQTFYAGECVPDDTGHSYLEIRMRPEVGDQRTNPINFDHGTLNPAVLGTHIIDYAFALGELKSLVAAKAAAMP